MDGFADIRDRVRHGRKELDLMRRHQDWVKMHAETHITPQHGAAMSGFLAMVRKIIAPEKYTMFVSLLRNPLPTTAVVNAVFDRLSRVFEGRDPSFNYQFDGTEYADDWEWYRQEVLHEPEVWRNKAWEYFRTEPNSVIVVDMPEERTDREDRYLQPYFYWVTVDDIVDYDSATDGRILWILYKDDGKRLLYYADTERYRVFRYGGENGMDCTRPGEEVRSSEHGLGYCPATFFVQTPVSLSHPDVKKSPITDVLSELDWYLFFATSKKHLDTYGSYPIYSGYERMCDYEEEIRVGDGTAHRHCRGGVLLDDTDTVCLGSDGEPVKCPVCGGHRIAGAGGYVEIPAPVDGIPDMRNPVQILPVDSTSLEWNAKELERKRCEIVSVCTGVDGDMLAEFSAGEHQVEATYEKQSTKLLRVKRELEVAQEFVDATVCRLRYGRKFLSLDINYGTEFYTTTTAQMRKRYSSARDGGAPEVDLMALRRQVIETEYRHNKLQLQRMLILSDVEPLVGMSVNAALGMYNQGLVNPDDMLVKADFESLVRRFERENGNVITFGERMPYSEKIDKIKETLKQYANENKPGNSDPRGLQGGSRQGDEERDGGQGTA